MKWDKINQQNRMRAHGVEPAAGPLSKDALRRQADALLAASKIPVQKLAPGKRSTDDPDAWRAHTDNRYQSRSSGGAPQIAKKAKVNGKGRPPHPKGTRKPLRVDFDTAVPPGLVVYCDGACEPNPGAGGWAFVVFRDGVEIHSESGGAAHTTNNQMELTGARVALRWIEANAFFDRSEPRLFCDSMYVVNGCNDWRMTWKANGWNKRTLNSPKRSEGEIKNLDLWKDIDAALTAFPLKLEWVKGHSGVIGNERADELSEIGRESAIEAARPTDLIADQFQRYSMIEGGAV